MSATTDPAFEQLQEDWPGWSIWLSSGGSWMATRRGPRSVASTEFSSPLGHLAMTLMEADHDGLRDALKEQDLLAEEIESRLSEQETVGDGA